MMADNRETRRIVAAFIRTRKPAYTPPPILLATFSAAAIFTLASWSIHFPAGKPVLIRKADAVVTLIEPVRPHYVPTITFSAKDYLPGGQAQH